MVVLSSQYVIGSGSVSEEPDTLPDSEIHSEPASPRRTLTSGISNTYQEMLSGERSKRGWIANAFHRSGSMPILSNKDKQSGLFSSRSRTGSSLSIESSSSGQSSSSRMSVLSLTSMLRKPPVATVLTEQQTWAQRLAPLEKKLTDMGATDRLGKYIDPEMPAAEFERMLSLAVSVVQNCSWGDRPVTRSVDNLQLLISSALVGLDELVSHADFKHRLTLAVVAEKLTDSNDGIKWKRASHRLAQKNVLSFLNVIDELLLKAPDIEDFRRIFDLSLMATELTRPGSRAKRQADQQLERIFALIKNLPNDEINDDELTARSALALHMVLKTVTASDANNAAQDILRVFNEEEHATSPTASR